MLDYRAEAVNLSAPAMKKHQRLTLSHDAGIDGHPAAVHAVFLVHRISSLPTAQTK